MKQPWQEQISFEEIEAALNYRFHDRQWLVTALTHSSYSFENRKEQLPSNERLEFLGDSVLGLIVSEVLYQRYRQWDEGKLSRLRSALVNEQTLHQLATKLSIPDFLLLGRGEEKNGGRERSKNVSRALEAVLGAVLQDSNYQSTKATFLTWVQKHYQDFFSEQVLENFDPKSRLQELVMKKLKLTPVYRSSHVDQETFEVSLFLGEQMLAQTKANSKKDGEKFLAKKVLNENKLILDLLKGENSAS